MNRKSMLSKCGTPLKDLMNNSEHDYFSYMDFLRSHANT